MYLRKVKLKGDIMNMIIIRIILLLSLSYCSLFAENNSSKNALSGFSFGVAIGYENYKTPYISEVETLGVNRIVRVSAKQNHKPSLWLETHYIWDDLLKKSA